MSRLMILIFVCLFLSFSAPLSQAATAPKQQSEYHEWFTEPTTRGTCSIIFSCLSTLLFCSSKILKPNIIPTGWKGRFMVLFQVAAAMFVPEVLYLMALGQYFDAKGVRDTINATAETFDRIPDARPKPSQQKSLRLLLTPWRYFTLEKKPQFIQLVACICTTPWFTQTKIKMTGSSRMPLVRTVDTCPRLLCYYGWLRN